jgi:hypothetical protein
MKKWDAFISHASEDKKEVVIPLYNYLKKSGLRIWYDNAELTIGDSLREKIEEGLAMSRFGIVVISKTFLLKKWPQRELNGLFSLEEENNKVILPVWHNIDKSEILKYSPILADKLSASTNEGIEKVGNELIKVILNPNSGSPSVEKPTLALMFKQILEKTDEKLSIIEFLKIHPNIIFNTLGIREDRCSVFWDIELSNYNIDLIVSETQMTTQTKKFFLFSFIKMKKLFDEKGNPEQELEYNQNKLEDLSKWINLNMAQAREIVTDIRPDFEGYIIPILRNQLDSKQKSLLKDYNNEIFGVSVRTYDWLLESII